MFRRFMDSLTRFVCWAKRNRVVDLPTGIVKVNVGSGLSVSPGWINVDASLNLLFSRLPRFVLRALYSVSGSRQLYSRQQYCDILKKNVFVQHNVEYGLPFPDQSVDFIYSSHLLEHLSPHDARHLLREAHRVLKKGGILRISVPDLERAVSRYEQGDKEELLKALLAASGRGYFVPHRYASTSTC
jgi:SAM-dependent methyltransferase